jgi:glutamate/aspartate transport system permease protein
MRVGLFLRHAAVFENVPGRVQDTLRTPEENNMSYQWDWQVFLRDTGAGETYLDWMLSAWGWTLSVAGCAWVVALIVGALIGTIRTVPHKGLQFFGNAWVELFRNFTSARVAEQVRAGIQALPRGQMMAGSAMGLTLPQTYRYVILPMAFRIVIPPLTSEAMNIIKNSSVAFAVSIAELTLFAMQVQEETSRGIEVYLAVTTLYMISAFAVNRVMAFIETRVRVPGYVGGGK